VNGVRVHISVLLADAFWIKKGLTCALNLKDHIGDEMEKLIKCPACDTMLNPKAKWCDECNRIIREMWDYGFDELMDDEDDYQE
jgi:uncharacterized protein with PIN domain